MTLPGMLDGLFAAFELNLTDRAEAVVGGEARVLGKIDANTTRIFVKFDKFEFGENFKYRPAWVAGRPFTRDPDMVTATVISRLIARWPALWQPKFHHDRQMDLRIAGNSRPDAAKGPAAAAL